MAINISIEKRHLWLIAAVFIFLVGVGYVIAYGSGNPAVYGHTANEVEGIAKEFVVPLATLDDYVNVIPAGCVYTNSAQFQYLTTSCQRWCSIGCTPAMEGCTANLAGQNYISGYAVGCSATTHAAVCVCIGK